ncbi:hypothetical protein M899_0223 [Bacteriovorax sp. BSW11_IV]|uniref:hypothetical protein n=1 Tax=Bacteriovorax sp. BSW11_IV TaxID=1353529 RepID=UPI00038A1897|nr:hypothetical protein [Bacteriovorax sp. BSW11_IV]EQC47027.1 hypothetical protein M899_0223 [Bacteriovorax sp. BSW11_IV]
MVKKRLLLISSFILIQQTFAWSYTPENISQAKTSENGITLVAKFQNLKEKSVEARSCAITDEFLEKHRINKIELLSAISRSELDIICTKNTNSPDISEKDLAISIQAHIQEKKQKKFFFD